MSAASPLRQSRSCPGHPRRGGALRKKDVMAGSCPAMTEASRFPSMHRGKKPRDAETGQPGPYRLATHAEIPRSDHGVGAADQIIHRQQPDAALADRNAAVGGG